jgi:hypothetical protein
MTTIKTMTLGFLTTLTLTGLTFITPSFAAHPDRVDVIGTLYEKVAQRDSSKNGGQGMRVDVIGRIDPKGPAYPYTKPMSR